MTIQNLLVIGGGPGGYTAAFLAAEKGMKVTIVDAHAKPGGVCLHQGCIPSKALLHAAKLISETRQARQWGLKFSEPEIDINGLRKWKDQIISKMTLGLVTLCKNRGVDIVHGRAVFKNSHLVEVNGKDILGFDYAVLAVGSSPVMPAKFDLNSPAIMGSRAALELETIPQKLLIVGGGYIGLEIGTIYAALGSGVTVVEMMDGLLPGVDRDLIRPLHLRLRKEFENIYTNTCVESLKVDENCIMAELTGEADPKRKSFDRVLVSVGRQPNSAGIGLENTGVELDDMGFVMVDNSQRTSDPAIYAIGDVVGGAMLAHKASSEAKVAVRMMTGEQVKSGHRVLPAVVFTDPEIAWCGLTETEANASGVVIETTSFPWGASGRATTLGRNDGLTKLIMEPGTDRILGIGVVGVGAGELIAEGVLAMEMGATAGDLASVIHPHPTLAETLMEAAEVHLGHPVHVYKKRDKG